MTQQARCVPILRMRKPRLGRGDNKSPHTAGRARVRIPTSAAQASRSLSLWGQSPGSQGQVERKGKGLDEVAPPHSRPSTPPETPAGHAFQKSYVRGNYPLLKISWAAGPGQVCGGIPSVILRPSSTAVRSVGGARSRASRQPSCLISPAATGLEHESGFLNLGTVDI